MLVEVTLKEFQNLAQLPSAKIIERYGDSAPVVELGDNKRYFSYAVNLECMNKKDYYTFYFYIEFIGTIIVTMFLYYIIF